MRATLDRPGEIGLNSLKFHLLDRLVEDVELFGYLKPLDAALFEKVIVHIKSIFQGSASKMLRMVDIEDASKKVPNW